MLTIGQVASRTGLRPSAIRYYEERGLLRRPARLGGKRVYPPSVFEQLAIIEMAKIAGFSLGDIRTLIADAGASGASNAWSRLIPARVAEVDEEMKRLRAIKGVLSKLNTCRCATLDECGRAFVEVRSQHRGTLQA
jgi:MerR family redox-sensitive transcriptional activator SoxR